MFLDVGDIYLLNELAGVYLDIVFQIPASFKNEGEPNDQPDRSIVLKRGKDRKYRCLLLKRKFNLGGRGGTRTLTPVFTGTRF